jgi:hypothetical protein
MRDTIYLIEGWLFALYQCIQRRRFTMKKLIVFTLVLSLVIPVIVQAGNVRGYWRDSDGDGIKDTYVQPYQRSNPDNSVTNNYGYPGNLNPNTGQITPGNPNNYGTSNPGYGYQPPKGYRY